MTSAVARARRDRVEDHLRAHCFGGRGPLRFGAEMELLAFEASTGAIAAILSANRPSTLPAVRAVAERLAWREGDCAKGVPRFLAPSGGALTFEPGGQLEYASAPHASIDAVVDELRLVHATLADECAARGVTLQTVGVDPCNGAADAPLQLNADRYRRMNTYFASIGADGARMMRQTASLQLCVGGVDVAARWSAANGIVPWLIALFANSARYAGRDTGCVSYRAETWRGVDPSRTGIVAGADDAVAAYASFALAAPAFLAGAEDEAPVPFAELADDRATDEALRVHLSTLFPEVRPRGYLELRSADAIGVEHHAAAMVFVAGLLADDTAAHAVLEIVGPSPEALLRAAGRSGLGDERLAARASELVELALTGCARLGPAVASARLLERARASFDQLASSSSPTAVLGPEVRSSRCFVSSDV